MRILQVPCSYFKSRHGLLTPTFIAGLERLFNLGSAHFPALYVSFLGFFFEIGHPIFFLFLPLFCNWTKFFASPTISTTLNGVKVAKQKKFSSEYQLANIEIFCAG